MHCNSVVAQSYSILDLLVFVRSAIGGGNSYFPKIKDF